MQLIRGLQNYPASNGCVATIGNFDGVHRGHRAIFARLAEVGEQLGLPLCALTFEPLPHEFFRPDGDTVRLSTLRNKSSAIAECGIDQLLLLRFNRQLAGLQAEEFINDALLSTLKVRHLVVGDDFRFGNQRRGDFAMLQAAGEQHGFGVESFNTVVSSSLAPLDTSDGSARISSSAIRQALAEHDFKQAAQLIGHSYSISGRVIKGQQLARQLGYPTANVCLKNFRPGIRGVFAVTLSIDGAWPDARQTYHGVANLGDRPTVDGKRLLLEVHVFDAEPDLYGQIVNVGFHHYLRGEKKFDGLDQLKQAIANDASAAREYFATA